MNKLRILTVLIAGAVLASFGLAQASEDAGCCSNAGASAEATTAESGAGMACCMNGVATETASAQGGSGMSCCSDGMPATADAGAQADVSRGGQGSMGQGGMMGGAKMGGMGKVMPDAMALLRAYNDLKRTFEEIPNGIRSTTTTTEPAVLDLLRRHPREMYAFYHAGGVVRPRDPMFGELARVSDKITMEFRDIENGIEVTATSDDADVVKLIRAHAAKVSDFVKRGMPAWHEGGTLPDDYVRPEE